MRDMNKQMNIVFTCDQLAAGINDTESNTNFISLSLPFHMNNMKAILHNEAKSPSRVHFLDLCNIFKFKPIYGVLHAWRP